MNYAIVAMQSYDITSYACKMIKGTSAMFRGTIGGKIGKKTALKWFWKIEFCGGRNCAPSCYGALNLPECARLANGSLVIRFGLG